MVIEIYTFVNPTISIRGITRTSYVQLPGRKYYIENDDVKIAALRSQF